MTSVYPSHVTCLGNEHAWCEKGGGINNQELREGKASLPVGRSLPAATVSYDSLGCVCTTGVPQVGLNLDSSAVR